MPWDFSNWEIAFVRGVCCYLSISQLPVAISRLSSKVNLIRLPSNSGTCTLSSYVEDNMNLTRLPSNSGFDKDDI